MTVVRFSAFLVIVGVLLLTLQWRGPASPWVTGFALVFGGGGAWIRVASLPAAAAARPRRPYAKRNALAGWTLGRVSRWAISAVLVLLAPVLGGVIADATGDSASGLIAGIILVAAGIAGLVMNRRGAERPVLRRATSAAGEALWTRDHPWDERGESRRFLHYFASRRMVLGRTCTLFSLAALPISAPLASSPFVFSVKMALAAGSAWFLWRAWCVFVLGAATLGFQRFPFHPGERVALTFGVSEGGAEVRDATLVLRHFTESVGGLGPGSGLPYSTFSVNESGNPAPRTFAAGIHQPVAFDLPDVARGTRIDAAQRSYWEVEVRGVTDEGPYEERFLVPVYARPATA